MKPFLISRRLTGSFLGIVAVTIVGFLAYLAIPFDKVGLSTIQLIIAISFIALLPALAIGFSGLTKLKKKTYFK